MKHLFLLQIMLFLTSSIFSQNNAPAGLAATWKNSQEGYEIILIINKNGTGSLEGEAFSYQVSGNQFKMITDYGTVVYTYNLAGNLLTLSGGDLDYPLTFSSTQSDTKSNAASTNLNSLTGNNNSTISQKSSKTGEDITGTWQGSGGTVIFRSDGIMVYNNINYYYSAQNGTLTLTGTDGSQSINYSLNGNSLTLSFGGQSAVYSKTTGSTDAGKNVNRTSNSSGEIDRSMVGKWCVSSTYVNNYQGGGSSHSECVILNDNGTYEYYSEGSVSGYSMDQSYWGGASSQGVDKGTWKVSGNLLIATSTSGETKTYQFYKQNNKNNEPALIIDGKEFATYYSKPPW